MKTKEQQQPEPKPTATIIFAGEDAESPTLFRSDKRIGRNDPCPCGSGKKAKNCCGTKPTLSYHKYRPRVTPEAKMKNYRKRIPFEVGEAVLASKAFPVESYRGKELIVTARGMEERFGTFYFKVMVPVGIPEDIAKLVDTTLWYSDGHLVKPEHYDQD